MLSGYQKTAFYAIVVISEGLLYVIQDFTKSTRMDFFFATSKPPAFSYTVNMPKNLKRDDFLRKIFAENKNFSTPKHREINKSQAIFLLICISRRFHIGN